MSKNSPVKVRLGAWVPKAIEAFGELIERISLLPERKESARLENEARKIEIAIGVIERLNMNDKNTLSESQKIALANELLHDLAKVQDRKKQLRVLNVRSDRGKRANN